MGEFKAGQNYKTICIKCGKEFSVKVSGQKYCYDPCRPDKPALVNWGMVDKSRLHRDCVMFHDGKKPFCSGLNGLYCGLEECKFYKSKSK